MRLLASTNSECIWQGDSSRAIKLDRNYLLHMEIDTKVYKCLAIFIHKIILCWTLDAPDLFVMLKFSCRPNNLG